MNALVYLGLAAAVLSLTGLTLIIATVAMVFRLARRGDPNSPFPQVVRRAVEKHAASLPTVAELSEMRPWGTSHLWGLLDALWFVYRLPAAALRFGLLFRFGVRWAWSVPFSLYELWDLAVIAAAWHLIAHGRATLGLALAIFMLLALLVDVAEPFRRSPSRPTSLLSDPLHKLGVAERLWTGCTIVLGFGLLHLGIGRTDPSAYTQPLDPLNALYFSLVTITTLGYGDIAPASGAAKIAAIIESIYGFLFVAMYFAAYLAVLIARRHDAESDAVAAPPPLPPNGSVPRPGSG